MAALAIILAVVFALFMHVILVAVLARRAGIAVSRVAVFFGPRILRTTIGGVPVEVGVVPLGSYVAFPPIDPEDPSRTVRDLAPRSTRFLLAVAPWALMVLLALPILGPVAGLKSFAATFHQYPAGLLFFSYGHELVGAIAAACATLPPHELAALTLVKVCGANLLPMPQISGWHALEALVGRSLPARMGATFSAIAALCVLGWIIAVVRYLI